MRQGRLKRGDKVEWWSSGGHRSKAVFVEYDTDFPTKLCILAIKIGAKGDQMVHTFRWPLSQVAMQKAGRTIETTNRKGT